MRGRRAALWLCVLAMGVASSPPDVSAQRPDSIPMSDSLDLILLDSILVEVLRSPIRLEDAPYSISVFGEQELFGAKGLVSIEELLEGMPGVQIQNRYNDAVGERISIRGYGETRPIADNTTEEGRAQAEALLAESVARDC